MNVLIGVPGNCEMKFKVNLEGFLRGGIKDIGVVSFVNSLSEYLIALEKDEYIYDASIVFETLNEKEPVYEYFLKGVKEKYRDMSLVVVVPNGAKGSERLKGLLDDGIYNVVFQSDMQKVLSIVNTPRDIAAAAEYYNVSLERTGVTNATALSEVNTKVGKIDGVVLKKDAKVQVRRFGDSFEVVTLWGGDAKSVTKSKEEEFGHVLELLKNGGDIDNLDCEEMAFYEFEIDEPWVGEYVQKLLGYYRRDGLAEYQSFSHGDIDLDRFKRSIHSVASKYKLTEEKRETVINCFLREINGYGPLEVAMKNDDVSDILLRDYNIVNVQIKGVWYRTNISFPDRESYTYYIRKVCEKNHSPINLQQGQVTFSDYKSLDNCRLRFTVSADFLSQNEQYFMHVRTVRKIKKLARELISEKFWTEEEAGFLIDQARRGKSILFVGGTGSGKSTGLNCVMEYLRKDIRGECIQSADELFLDNHPNFNFVHSISEKGEGKISYDLQRLATTSLMTNTEIFVVGEVKDEAAKGILTAAKTGAQWMASTHGDDVFEGLPRIADLAIGGSNYTRGELMSMLAHSADYVVFMEKYKVKTIAEVCEWDSEKKDVKYNIYRFLKNAG